MPSSARPIDRASEIAFDPAGTGMVATTVQAAVVEARAAASAGSGFKDVVAPPGWDATWRAALAASATTPAVISFIGHSVPQGFTSSDFVNKGYMGLMAAALKAKYGARGDFWCTTDSQYFLSVKGGYTWGGVPPWVISGNPQWYNGFGYTSTPFWVQQTATVATFVTPYACTAMEIVYFDYAAGTFLYSVDGGAPATVTTTGNGQRRRIALTGLSSAAHTVAFSNPSATNVLGLAGIATYQGTAGIAVARLAFGYGQAANYTAGIQANGANTAGQVYLWQGLQGQAGPQTAATGFGFPAGAHLAVIEHGTNDGASPTLMDNLGAIIAAVRRATPDASILLVATPYPTQSSDYAPGSGATLLAGYPEVMAYQASVASSHGAAFASIQARWGSTAFAKGFVAATNQHPVDAGHADIAAFLGQIVY